MGLADMFRYDPNEASTVEFQRIRRRTDHLIPDTPGDDELVLRLMKGNLKDLGRDMSKIIAAQQARIEKLERRLRKLENGAR